MMENELEMNTRRLAARNCSAADVGHMMSMGDSKGVNQTPKSWLDSCKTNSRGLLEPALKPFFFRMQMICFSKESQQRTSQTTQRRAFAAADSHKSLVVSKELGFTLLWDVVPAENMGRLDIVQAENMGTEIPKESQR